MWGPPVRYTHTALDKKGYPHACDGLGGSVGYVLPTSDQEVAGLFSARFDHEIFSSVILYLPLIQEGHLSVSGERMCTNTG